MKICFVSAVLIMLFSIHALNSQSRQPVNSTLKETSLSLIDSQKVILTEKSPLFAGTLSFIVPGLALGQFYNGQILKGILHVAISGLGFVMFAKGVYSGSSEHSFAYAGFVLYLGNWIYTTFEAIATAEEINKQVKLQKYRSDIMDKLKFGITVNKNKQLNLKFAFDL